jgi:dienelactone hydrolase
MFAGKLAGAFLLLAALLTARAAPCVAAARPVTLTVEGQPVAALYWLPARSGAGKVPAVILLHMLGRSKEDWRGFGDLLERSGYAALAVDLRGGGNAGERKLVGDARAAFDFLARQPEVDAARIGVVGASIGANGALLFAVEEPRVRCAALLSPGLEYRGVSTVPAISKMTRPVLLVSSEDDQYSAESVRRLNQLAPGPKALKIYSGAGHGTQIFAAGVGLDQELLAFLKAHL